MVSLYFFFHTKDFEEEYSKHNEQIISILHQEFKLRLMQWIKSEEMPRPKMT